MKLLNKIKLWLSVRLNNNFTIKNDEIELHKIQFGKNLSFFNCDIQIGSTITLHNAVFRDCNIRILNNSKILIVENVQVVDSRLDIDTTDCVFAPYNTLRIDNSLCITNTDISMTAGKSLIDGVSGIYLLDIKSKHLVNFSVPWVGENKPNKCEADGCEFHFLSHIPNTDNLVLIDSKIELFESNAVIDCKSLYSGTTVDSSNDIRINVYDIEDSIIRGNQVSIFSDNVINNSTLYGIEKLYISSKDADKKVVFVNNLVVTKYLTGRGVRMKLSKIYRDRKRMVLSEEIDCVTKTFEEYKRN